MKIKILIIFSVLVLVGIGSYFYMYKNHRDISSEEANYSLSVESLQKEFLANSEASNKKYLDKTIAVNGIITSIDKVNHSIVLDKKLYAVFIDSTMDNVILNKQITLKGRFIGYDDLLEEFKIDQVSISK